MNNIKSSINWFFFQVWEILRKYFWLPFYNLPTNRSVQYTKININRNVVIPMRDGIKLKADIYLPAKTGKFPVILIRMPYGKQEAYCYMPAHGKYWARYGYGCVIQDVRGKWSSEGVWEPFVNEANDGYDTIDWINKQTWCDGNIGMTGESYYGYTQWAVASLSHPSLKCIVPGNTAADIYGSWMYNSFAFCFKTMGNWLIQMKSRRYNNYLKINSRDLPLNEIADKAGLPSEDYRACLEHPERDAYWDHINVDHKFDQIAIPILHWGGWYDVFLKGTIDAWEGMRKLSDDHQNKNQQWLLISPTDHEITPFFTGRIGKLRVGLDAWSYDRILEFFDHFLKGKENRYSKELSKSHVEIFIMGDNKWRLEKEWPLARTEYTPYYFHSNGSANGLDGNGWLSVSPPEDEPSDKYIYDPEKPVNLSEQIDLWHLAEEMEDRTEFEKREDILIYTSEIFSSEIEVTGPIRASLFAASSAHDTDFTVTLVDVFPDGCSQLVQEGIVRARYRDGENAPSLIEPQKIYHYNVDLWATSYVFKAGHRIRVEVSSSNFDRYDRNLNQGGKFAYEENSCLAHQTIYHNSKYLSCIVLPIIPR